jgi:Na+/H+ antiporter NhaC
MVGRSNISEICRSDARSFSYGDDHVSPISDTTLVSSMAAASDHIDHVRTQLPYALIAAMGATVLFAVFGVILH